MPEEHALAENPAEVSIGPERTVKKGKQGHESLGPLSRLARINVVKAIPEVEPEPGDRFGIIGILGNALFEQLDGLFMRTLQFPFSDLFPLALHRQYQPWCRRQA